MGPHDMLPPDVPKLFDLRSNDLGGRGASGDGNQRNPADNLIAFERGMPDDIRRLFHADGSLCGEQREMADMADGAVLLRRVLVPDTRIYGENCRR